MQVTLEHVTHTYQPGSPFQATAIQDVNMTIREGEFLALIGHTGSGKSTLAQHINGLLKPTEGRVLLDGQDIHEKGCNKKEVRQKVGLVFQYPEHQLFEETVAKDVAFGPKNLGLDEAEIKERVREALHKAGLDPDAMEGRSPFELSGGQMRRVAIAGVLAMRPSVLILDEPTAGRDPRGRDRILSMLEELHAREKVTVVMVSHSMDDMARLATRLIVVSGGKILADGTPREIFSQEEMMVSAGLGVPEAARLCAALRRKGFSLPADLYRPEELKEHLLRLWKDVRGSEKEAEPC